MNILLFIVGLTAVFVIYGSYVSKREAARAAKNAIILLQEIDRKYSDTSGRIITSNILKNNNMDINEQNLTSDIMMIIKPEIDSLFVLINSTQNSEVKIDYYSLNFKSISSTVESYFIKRHQLKKSMNEDDKKEFYITLRDYILADISQKLMDLKSSNYV